MWMKRRKPDPELEAAMRELERVSKELAHWPLFWPK